MSILSCDKVTMKFGALVAVNSLSFEVEKGEIFGISGPNGAGKSTLFNVITGFYQGSGDIYFEDVKINKMRPYKICNLGIARTFQIPQLCQSLSVFDNIKIGAHFGVEGPHNDMEIIDKAIDFVDLAGKESIIADNLNLLDKKKTMIAAALATNPRVLMLDEPTGGLSPAEVKQSIDLFRKINEELGITIIVIEHLMKVLTELAQRMMIIHMGSKICIGPPCDVTQDNRVIKIYLGG